MNDLPTGWIEAPLGSVADIVSGQSPPGSAYNTDGIGLPFFQGKAEFGELRPTVRKWTTVAVRKAEQDDVLLSVRAPVGPTNLAPDECAIGRGLAAIRALGGVEPRYLLYAIRATAETLKTKATGTTFPAVTGPAVRDHRLRVAPPEEQRRIVAAIEEQFSRLDAAGESLSAARHRVDQLRIAAAVDGARGDWPEVVLGDVTREQVYGTSAKTSEDSSGVPVLRMGNIQSGRIIFDKLKYLPAGHPDSSKFVLEPGDVLFNRTNSPELVGKSAVFGGAAERMIFASYLIRLRLTDDCLPEWASLIINGPIGRR